MIFCKSRKRRETGLVCRFELKCVYRMEVGTAAVCDVKLDKGVGTEGKEKDEL